MRRGFDGLAAMVQNTLDLNPFSCHVFVFRGRRGDRVKLLIDNLKRMVFGRRSEKLMRQIELELEERQTTEVEHALVSVPVEPAPRARAPRKPFPYPLPRET